ARDGIVPLPGFSARSSASRRSRRDEMLQRRNIARDRRSLKSTMTFSARGPTARRDVQALSGAQKIADGVRRSRNYLQDRRQEAPNSLILHSSAIFGAQGKRCA